MEEIHTKLQGVVIGEVNSNHFVDTIHASKKSNGKSCETDHECQQENGTDQQLQNGSSLSPPNDASHQTSFDCSTITNLSETSPPLREALLPKGSSDKALDIETVVIDRGEESFEITYKVYESELELPSIMKLIQKDLSEPYSVYTYRYFIHNWPQLCYLALYQDKCVGCIVCKLDIHRQMIKRGYIAMLAVDKDYRKLKIGTTLVQKAIRVMIAHQADEVVLETEITNQPALKLYENLGFVRDKRLFHYYLNGVDALRLKVSLEINFSNNFNHSSVLSSALVQMNCHALVIHQISHLLLTNRRSLDLSCERGTRSSSLELHHQRKTFA